MKLKPEYLGGIELFNRGEYFECHEVLESLWQSAPEPERSFLHAVIQVAAALHHEQRGNHKGARSVWQRARKKLIALPAQMMQVETAALVRQVDDFFAIASGAADDSQSLRPNRPRIDLTD
jgi:hypothetical protein